MTWYTGVMIRLVVTTLVVVGLGYLYLNREAFLDGEPSTYCVDYQARIAEPEYNLSYGERARAAAHGCL